MMPRTDELVVESRSSVQITRNAKGETQVSVKMYDEPEMTASRLRKLIADALVAFTATEEMLVELERGEPQLQEVS